jgi:hypothetical protein
MLSMCTSTPFRFDLNFILVGRLAVAISLLPRAADGNQSVMCLPVSR